MKKAVGKISLCLFSVLLSCGFAKDKQEAVLAVSAFYEAVQAEDYDLAMTFRSEEALVASPREQWVAVLKVMNTTLGGIQTYEESGKFNVSKDANVGTQVKLEYSVKYADEVMTTENFTLIRLPGSDKFLIKNYDRKVVPGSAEPSQKDTTITA